MCGTSDCGDLVVNSRTFSVPPEQNLTFGHQIQTPTHPWYHEFPPRHRRDVLFLRTRLRLNLADLVHWPLKSNQSKPKSRRTSAQAVAALVGGEKTNKGTRFSSGGLLKFSVTAVSAGSHSLRGYSLSALQRKTSSCYLCKFKSSCHPLCALYTRLTPGRLSRSASLNDVRQ